MRIAEADNTAQYWPSIGPIPSQLLLLLWDPVPIVEEPESGPWTAHYWAICHFYHGKLFWKWEKQSSAQHWPVTVPKTSVGGQSLGQNWPPSVYRSYHSSNGTILATHIWQHFCRCWTSVGPYLTSHLSSYILTYVYRYKRINVNSKHTNKRSNTNLTQLNLTAQRIHS